MKFILRTDKTVSEECDLPTILKMVGKNISELPLGSELKLIIEKTEEHDKK